MQKTKVTLAFGFLLTTFSVASQAQVTVSRTANEITIGNAYMKRSFGIKDGKLRPGTLTNLRVSNDGAFTPAEVGSEEFAFNPVTTAKPIAGLIDRTNWSLTADGYNVDGSTGLIAHAIDGDNTTYWHSNYGTGNTEMPHYLQVDMQTEQTVRSFAYAPRPGNSGANGQVKGYKIHVGNDPNNLTLVATGDISFKSELQWIDLPADARGRYVKFEITSSHNGRKFAACAEFMLSSQAQNTATTSMQPLDRTGWQASADSWCVESATVGEPKHIIDGNDNTVWHTWYSGQTQGVPNTQALPHSFMLNLNGEKTFRSFGYMPRAGLQNGCIKDYQFYVSNDSVTWTLVKEGRMDYEEVALQWVDLGQNHTARYVKLTQLSSLNGREFGSCAEFYLSAEIAPQPAVSYFTASEMTLNGVTEEAIEGGKRLVFDMAPYAHTNPKNGITATWDIDMVVEMKDNDHFLRKYLRIKALDDAARETPIDYIEMENLSVAGVPADQQWTHPSGSGGVGGMTAYTLTLGQPVYIKGMFFGSEFPQAENEISDGSAHTRYFSGKSFIKLSNEGRLTADGTFRTWNNVVGASRSTTDLNVIRSDFFAYINTIARPTKLRLQYNSWYDWMMRITEERINHSFKEIERGFTQYGIRPIDSYVVDDGWNNYQVSDVERSGVGNNQTGFWEFNSKFPNGLKGASDIARRYGSEFGIWLGPRGGYNFNASWGRLLEAAGNGTYNQNSGDAVTGDSVYIAKLEDFFLRNQREYGVNYWKLDGFSTVQPQPSRNGRYITGGKSGNYYFTEHWERWYKTFEKMYAEAAERQSDLWLNLTCYVNPSPWILQWGNSVWMQNSQDKGNTNVGGRTRQMDQFISYRDDRYYDFINGNQLQFPLANIFNHDPIYGQEEGVAANSMTDSEFRAYLYMIATRGTAFWEMLYSYNFMNEGQKWLVNAEAINFIEKHYDILRNAKYFGASPRAGNIYGYSCWNNDEANNKVEGIVSFRNPSNANKTYTFTLDNTVGVPEQASGLWRSLVMAYSGVQTETPADIETGDDNSAAFAYGNQITLTLKPGEIRIWKFSTQKDETPAAFYTVKSVSERSVEVKFDEPIKAASASSFKLYDGTTLVATATTLTTAADYRTLTLGFGTTLESNKLYTVKAEGIADWNGNTTTAASPAFYYNEGNVVTKIETPADLVNAENVAQTGEFREGRLMLLTQSYTAVTPKAFVGKGAFSVTLVVNTTAQNATLLSQGSAYRVAIVDGKPSFTVGGQTFTADSVINDGTNTLITCTRENNGMLKIYRNGQLLGTGYDKNLINEDLVAAPITLGGSGANVALGNVEIRQDAYTYSQAAQVDSAYAAPRYLITVTAPDEVNITFLGTNDTTTVNNDLVARVPSGTRVTVKGEPSSADYKITKYTVDGVETSAEGSTTITIRFASVTADHTIVVESMTTGIGSIEQNLTLNFGRQTIGVSGAEGTVVMNVHTADGKYLGTGRGVNEAEVNVGTWAKGTYIIDVQTATGKKTFKVTK